MKKLIFLENKEQALYFLKNKNKFEKVIPVSLSFEVEKTLAENKINFKIDDDYENSFLYEELYTSSLEKTKKLLSGLKFYYKDINLIELFYSDIFKFVALLERYSRLVNQVLKKEKPERIYLFEKRNSDILNKIAKIYFSGNVDILKCSEKNKKEEIIFELAGKFQRLISKAKINFAGKNNKYIFFSGSRSLFDPILIRLLKNKKNLIFRCHNNLQKSFIMNNRYIPFYHFLGKESKLQNSLKKEISFFAKKIEKSNLSDIFGEEDSLLKEWLLNLINQKFIQTAKIIDEIIYLIKTKKINLVLLDDTFNYFERTLTTVCKKFNVPTVVVQHGLMGADIPPVSDYVLAWGEQSKKEYMKIGFPKEKIIVVGSPQYDSLMKQAKSIRKSSENNKILYIVDAVNNHELIPGYHLTKKQQKESFKMLFKTMKKFPNCKLVIKGRKNWDLNDLAQYKAKQENFEDLKFLVDADKIELLSSAAVVIIHYTTMGLEAMLFDKSVISLEFKGMEKWNNFAKMNNVELVYNEKELVRAIKKALNMTEKYKNEREKTLKNELFSLNGKATERAINFINNLINI